MSRTVTAMFDSRADAEAGAERLRQAGLNAENVHIHDQSTHNTSGQYSTHQDQGAWAAIKNAFLPDEDRHTFDEGMRRGHFIVTADVAEHDADQAVRALDEANSVDIDARSQSWRNEGWEYPAGGATGLFGGRDQQSDSYADTETRGSGGAGGVGGGGGRATEERIPVIEEQLVVGKREVERGGVRVRSYVTEVPVHEQVRLREERVAVERRAVDQPVDAGAGDAFRERTIDVTATAEEAVVAKTARVVEEVVVSKTSGERTEEIADTVHRTEVEVDDTTGAAERDTPRRDGY